MERVEAVDLTSTVPANSAELEPLRAALCQLLRDLARLLTKRELELMQAREAAEFAAIVRSIAGELGAAAATWARASDTIRGSWKS